MLLKDEKSQLKLRKYKEEPNRNLKNEKKKVTKKTKNTLLDGLITEWRWESITEVKNKSLKVFQFELLNEKNWERKLIVLLMCGKVSGHLNPGRRGKSAV